MPSLIKLQHYGTKKDSGVQHWCHCRSIQTSGWSSTHC